MNRHLFYSLCYIREKSSVSVVVAIDYDPSCRSSSSSSPVNLWESAQQGIRDLVKITADESIVRRQMFWNRKDEANGSGIETLLLMPVLSEEDMRVALEKAQTVDQAKFLIFQEETAAAAAAKDLSGVLDAMTLK